MDKGHTTKTVVSFFLSILLIGLFFSCNTEEDGNNHSKKVLCYPNIGKIHNQILDSVFKDLREAKINLRLTNPTRSSSQSSLTFEQAFEIAQKSTYSNLEKVQDKIPSMVPDSIKIKEFMYDVIFKTRSVSHIKQLLTPSQQIFYLQIQNILNENGATASQIQQRLLELQDNIKNSSMTNMESDLLYYGISVAYYSAQYWEENISKWSTLIGKPVKNNKITRVDPGYHLTTLFPKNKFPDNNDVILVPFEDDPHYYFELVDNRNDEYFTGILMKCPGDLVYNREICACDFEWNIGQIAEVDVWGCIGGAAAGATVGLIGGVTAVPAAADGAIQGAVSSSVIKGLELVWRYFNN